jgi:Protein of unknown function (DUF3429)
MRPTVTQDALMSPSPRPLIFSLGYAGLLPFVGLAAAVWLLPASQARLATFALGAYGAVIVSFLGGIHWGLGFQMGEAAPHLHFLWGITTPLLAWVALLLPPWAGLMLLVGALLLCLAVDRSSYPAIGLARWLPLRFRLTVVAGLSCLAGAVGAWRQVGL